MGLFKSKHMPQKVLVNNKIGNVVGCYCYPHWHPYMFKAYHVEFEDGSQKTVIAKETKIVEN
ncbi:MAG: hypothetical protein ACOCZ5_00605 [bacterium]